MPKSKKSPKQNKRNVRTSAKANLSDLKPKKEPTGGATGGAGGGKIKFNEF